MENKILFWSVAGAMLLLVEWLYFKLAERFQIVDRPNERSSHSSVIIRGGGVVFVVSLIGWFLESQLWPWFAAASLLIAFISFWDDVSSMPARVRLLIHAIAMTMILMQLQSGWGIGVMVAVGIVAVGILNAFNFMDGINGITGCYALATVSTLLYLESSVVHFTDTHLLSWLLLALIVFLFFNFRKRARCFAGDVGSVSIAFSIVFVMLQLILVTGNWMWILLLLVYGTDSVVTIILRLRRKENIFKPHRTHLYQYLANERSIDHRMISVAYALIQVVINVVVVNAFRTHDGFELIMVFILWLLVYAVVRFRVTRNLTTA